MEYVVLILFSIFVSYHYSYNGLSTRKYKYAYITLFLYCVLLFGLRYRVGIDTLNYMYSYSMQPTLDTLEWEKINTYRYAPLFMLLVATCRSITTDFWLLQITVSVIFNSCLLIFLKRQVSNPFLAFSLFFFMNGLYFNTEILRESLAVGVFLLNIDNLIKHKWMSYYILAIVSLMFHFSAIIVFLFPFFTKVRFNWQFLVLLLIFTLLRKYFEVFTIGMISMENVMERIDEFYLLIDSERLNANWLILVIIQTVMVPIVVIVINKMTIKVKQELEFILCIYLFLGLGCVYYQIIFQRFTNYVLLVLIVVMAEMLSSKVLENKYKILIISLFIIAYSYTYIRHERYERWYPYHSVFNPEKDFDRETMWFEEYGRTE